LNVSRNNKLTNLNGLINITSIGGDLNISSNDALTNIDGLSKLTSIEGDLRISDNDALTNIDGLSKITSTSGYLNIYYNVALTNIDGLNKLTSIGGDLRIIGNNVLTNLDGLNKITSISGHLYIYDNNKLTNLDGLSKLSSIGRALHIIGNSVLTNIDGLNNITSIRENLVVLKNIALTNIDGVGKLTSISGDLEIINNNVLTNLNGLNKLTSIGGDLRIGGNNVLTNLDGLSKLTSIGRGLYIYRNNMLTNLDGLSKITSIDGYLSIYGNDALTNIDGLNKLTSIGRDLAIIGNNVLTNLDGLSKITSIGGYLNIHSNNTLADCCGIQGILSTLSAIGEQIYIYDNPSECSSKDKILESTCEINTNILTFPSCIDAENGSLQITVNRYDTIPFYYKWERIEDSAMGSGSSLDNIFIVENLKGGTYNVTVTTPAPDTVIKTGIVLNQILGSVFEIIEITTTNSSNGYNNGSITIKTAGGTPPYTYDWSGVSSGSQNGIADNGYTINSLAQGEYSITVSDNVVNQQSVTVSLLDETVPVFPCTEPLDIVILNDVSGSVDAIEYRESKQFFVDFLNAANIGTNTDESRAAIIEWSDGGSQKIQIPITGDIAILQDYISYTRAFDGNTSPHQAMSFGKDYLDSVGRADVEKVIILSTDGESNQVSPSLIALADKFKAAGYHIVTIAFDNAFTNTETKDILTKVASNSHLAPGAPAYSLLDKDLADKIVNLYLCPIDPGSTAKAYFNRDGAIDILDIVPIGNCPYPDGVEISFTIEALRELSFPAGTPVTFYFNNPELFGATPISTWIMPCALTAGEIDTFTVILPVNTAGNIFAVLNDDGSQSPPIQFPVTGIEELAYSNNIDNQSICLDDIATLQALKYTTTPKPICDTLVIYTINVCNISEVDAFGVKVKDIPPDDFVLVGTIFNDNGCATDNGGVYDIPAGCCISLTLTYGVANAANGYYGNQGVHLDGPSGQDYIDFDGSTTTSEDVIIDGTLDCPSTNIEFTKEVNIYQSCDDAFVVYKFSIKNEMNIPLQGLVFTDILSDPCVWAFEPYLLEGLSIGNRDIDGNTASFVIDEILPDTTATFYLDAALNSWEMSGILSNTATLENVPDPDNGGYRTLTSNTVSTDITTTPTIILPDTIFAHQGDEIDLGINSTDSISWTTSGDGIFTDSSSNKTKYIPGVQDSLDQQVYLFVSIKSDCGETGKNIVIIFEQCSLSFTSFNIGDCNDNGTPSDNTDDTYEVTFNIFALNPGSSNTLNVKDSTKTYGQFSYISQGKITLPADGLDYNLVFEDSEVPGCTIQKTVSQQSCSDKHSNYFMSTSGSDTNDGTSEVNAWATFEHSYTIMKGGDTLTILDGTYFQELYPPVKLSGSEHSYTMYRAKNPGKVILAPTSIGDDEMEGVIYVFSNISRGITSYIHFDGLFAKGVGEHSAISIASMDFATEEQMTHHITLTRCGAMGSALGTNTDAFDIGSVRDILVEDCFAFGFGRKAMQLYGAKRITVRRMIVRYDWWQGHKYKPSDPRVNLSAYNTIGATLENIIAMDAGPHPASTSPDRAGLVASGNQGGGTAIDGSRDVNYLGCIVFNNNEFAKGLNAVEVNGGTGSPVKNLLFKDIVIYGADAGFNIHDNVDSIRLENITSTHNTHIGIRVNPYPSYTISNVKIDKVVSTDNKYDGIYWNEDMTHVELSNSTSVRNGEGDDIESQYEPEIKYLPINKPVMGFERGGIVRNKYIDGVLTEESLWPWPYEKVIKGFMCKEEYLQEIADSINLYEGTNIDYVPGLCKTDSSITGYIWSYLGNPCPDTICDNSVNTGDIFSKSQTNIEIYPNPAHNLIYIKAKLPLDTNHYNIYDICGKKLKFGTIIAGKIDISDFSQGVYFVRIQNNQKFLLGKFIVL